MAGKFESVYEAEYKKLNPAQKEAVDTIDGPVMVVAGPGTGKTQILALRIANILQKTDIKADAILCLTFTNSAVEEMKKRLERYIGEAGEQVNVYTFHSFGLKVIEEYYAVLGWKVKPKLLQDTDRAIFFDQILKENDWEYLRPRGNGMRYFEDLKSLISLLKRERVRVGDFEKALEKDTKSVEADETSKSTRGASKGELKKEVLKRLEGLERSREVVKFINLYEEAKKEKNLLDYDDVLESLVKIVESSEDALSAICERYLYVLVDEHQDSSRVQNEFLAGVWAELEKPDIFVVGDDRQLIYGFSGASIDHFKGFKKTFPGAKLITLVDNYRSTQVILDASHALLQSVMTDEKLISQSLDMHPIRLIEAATSEDEIAIAAADIKEKIAGGIKPSECAILVPKNKQARDALSILHQLGVPVRTDETVGLFDSEGAHVFLRVLKILADGDTVSLALSFFDKLSGVAPILAHKFIAGQKVKELSFDKLTGAHRSLFSSESVVEKWIEKLSKWKKDSKNLDLKTLLKTAGEELFGVEKEKPKLVSGEEILNTVMALLAHEEEKNPEITLSQFVSFLDKLASYGEHIPIVSAPKEGVRVLTMHGSKGLEFEYVWIAHMNERSLAGGKRVGFALPESIAEKVEERDIDAIKRKLYVSITRAKRFCTLSYATLSRNERDQELAKIISDLPAEVFKKEKAVSPKQIKKEKNNQFEELAELVSKKYQERYISASLLNNFFECPWKWYFRSLLRLPEPRAESLEFGNAVHKAIDQILKLKKEILPEDKEVARVVSAWIKNRLSQIADRRESEKSISAKDDKFPHFNIFGKIDLVEYLNSKNLRVTDFKTGSVRRKSEIEKLDDEGRMSAYLRQLAMYSYLIKQSSQNELNASQSRLEFLEAKNPKESFYDTVIENGEINLLLKDIADYDELVKGGKWVYRPCNYNSYGQNTECEYCKMAEVYKN